MRFSSGPQTPIHGAETIRSVVANSTMDEDALKRRAIAMARDGRTITQISEALGISWGEARSYLPTSSWMGAKIKITIRLKNLAGEPDQAKREKLADEADKYADFLYDAAKHLRGQVEGVKRALNR